MRKAAVLLTLLAAAPAAAQDRTRLDEFALPESKESVEVDQLAQDEPLPREQPHDRSLSVPQPPASAPGPVVQLTTPDGAAPQGQLTAREASRRIAPASVSSVAQSKPAPAAPIAGHDRCDPQALQGVERTRCLRILELRAAEFNATEPPVLSPEEKLLSVQQRRPGASSRSAGEHSNLAAADPDADFQANQEIAAIYLNRSDVPPPQGSRDAPEETVPSADLIEALQAILPPGALQN